jgi:ABC-2 type transport system permease protein
MENIFAIALNTIKRNAKEKKVIFMMIIFPIVLILILGNALKSAFEPSNIGDITVGFANQDKAVISEQFDKFLHSSEISDIIKVKEVNSLVEGKQLLEDKKIDTLVYIGPGYSESITQADKKAEIEVISSDVSSYKATVVKSIVDSFVNGANVTSALNQLTQEYGVTSKYVGEKVIKDVVLTVSGERPGAIDYYAITMLVMILMYGIAYAAEGLGEEVFGLMKIRFRSLPVKSLEMFIGKTIGSIALIFIQGLIIVGITKFGFNVQWGNSVAFLLLMLLIISIFSTSLGIMLCTITKDVERARGLINLLVPLFTFISGGYFKVDLGMLKFLSPNYLMQSALFNNIYGGKSNTTIMYIGVILFLVVITAAVSVFQGRRKLA